MKRIISCILILLMLLFSACAEHGGGEEAGQTEVPAETFDPSLLINAGPITVGPEDFSEELIARATNPRAFLDDKRICFSYIDGKLEDDTFDVQLTPMMFGSMQEAIEFIGIEGIPDFSLLGLPESVDWSGDPQSTGLYGSLKDGQIASVSLSKDYEPVKDPGSPYKHIKNVIVAVTITSTAKTSAGDDAGYKWLFNEDSGYSFERVLRAKSGARGCLFYLDKPFTLYDTLPDGSETEFTYYKCAVENGSFSYDLSVYFPSLYREEADALIEAWLELI